MVFIFSNLYNKLTKQYKSDFNFKEVNEDSNDFIFTNENQIEERVKREEKVWGPWGHWSACSVSCGVGEKVMFRYCISDSCALGEKEAKVKPCNMAPCERNVLKEFESNLQSDTFWYPDQ